MARVRTVVPVRNQVAMVTLEDLLPALHRARLLWQVVEKLDLSAFERDALAREGAAGRPCVGAKVLLTVWLYAVSINVGSAREIERLMTTDPAFRWITGDQPMSRTTLGRFRVGHEEALDELMTKVLGTLLEKKLVSLELVAQDGTRVRASASAPSFRREAALEDCLEQAQLHLKAVLADDEGSIASQMARELGARDVEKRVEQAIEQVNAMLEKKQGGDEPRASTTDPEARVMKMGDGGFRPAYNAQFVTAGDPMGGPRTIVAARVTNVGSDMGSIEPMLDQIARRTNGGKPTTLLADGGHADIASLTAAHDRGVTALIAVPKRSAANGARADQSPAVAAWRARMQTEEAKQLFRARASLCELPNAHAKTRFAMSSFLVRGVHRVGCVLLLVAITHNLVNHLAKLLA